MESATIERKPVKALADTGSPSRSAVFCALSIALVAVCANVTIPVGPIPFTLQMLAMPFMIQILSPRQAVAVIFGYVLLGVVGLPVFSGMRGGIGVLLGPTAGFIWAYLVAVPLAALVLWLFRRRGIDGFATGVLSGVVFTAVSYVGGWLWYMVMAGVTPLQSFLVTVAPFVVLDFIKVLIATGAARVVVRAIGR